MRAPVSLIDGLGSHIVWTNQPNFLDSYSNGVAARDLTSATARFLVLSTPEAAGLVTISQHQP